MEQDWLWPFLASQPQKTASQQQYIIALKPAGWTGPIDSITSGHAADAGADTAVAQDQLEVQDLSGDLMEVREGSVDRQLGQVHNLPHQLHGHLPHGQLDDIDIPAGLDGPDPSSTAKAAQDSKPLLHKAVHLQHLAVNFLDTVSRLWLLLLQIGQRRGDAGDNRPHATALA